MASSIQRILKFMLVKLFPLLNIHLSGLYPIIHTLSTFTLISICLICILMDYHFYLRNSPINQWEKKLNLKSLKFRNLNKNWLFNLNHLQFRNKLKKLKKKKNFQRKNHSCWKNKIFLRNQVYQIRNHLNLSFLPNLLTIFQKTWKLKSIACKIC